jgi:hypothetical protein
MYKKTLIYKFTNANVILKPTLDDFRSFDGSIIKVTNCMQMARVQILSWPRITLLSTAYEHNGGILIAETFKTYIFPFMYFVK